ncbi:deoxyguanosinetriphosphate triphosphohydrolase [Dichelobacter nodosus]|uniref:Deoxyguanosinetriphosphate triphosphohydrolase n=1 Tax=Dichelobacter nodosus (strain VCS1703A) TaxID=246195 RepID=A5EWC6_DICNV|nr:deoxyguanosinetriphosphate triphosphohydrolase [Dichelobacter nodosus]ABQ14229.1 deoxyguanosinetriphosphate triphosphohydrolase [Dichelobacter nodosus VCS1703A]AXM45169.1 deoxyguanosinetriphosphate triphosphohydrolase [Dichelobacter nodosus]KNZ39578.1 deoxyguanosinetriphosphate triphosphohydrolase [Dichelobacter nodosus]TGA66012.1 deoxyguanosinetriphosphate triphosphohydrolase [Dichelobacter nodosus]
MNWLSLCSDARMGGASLPEPLIRSEYQRDSDRILFSAAFRRMQDKTQVFPLAKNDFVRTRLTHSLEVSCVGRSLGNRVGVHLLQKYPELVAQKITAANIGDIVAAACLAHDLGNPPFGHSGEQAMRDYFCSENGQNILERLKISTDERADLTAIEGNAQSFRIVSRLENPDANGGLRLTYATLATMAKYPCTAACLEQSGYQKNGCYQDDLATYTQIFSALGIPQIKPQVWLRHPLSYLMEAADDICYLIVDIEDAYQVKQIHFEEAYARLFELVRENVDETRIKAMHSKSDKLGYLRAKAIGQLIDETCAQFWQSESAILNGNGAALLPHIPSYRQLKALRQFASDYIYNLQPVVEIQVAGNRILRGLLDIFCTAVANTVLNNKTSRRHDEMILLLLPTRYRRYADSPYQKLLAVCDYVSGMTDSYAVSLYKKLTGISL